MTIWYGGDYNPEQWPEDVWAEDVELMRWAGVNIATVGVFAWARIQPDEGVFDYGWLDRVLDLLHAGGIAVDLATGTASTPPWATALVRSTVERYKDHPAVVMWHINNELGCHMVYDYSDQAAAAFRGWLRDRYGELDTLNSVFA